MLYKGEFMSHPLHLKVGKAINNKIGDKAVLVRDQACGGTQHIPLFNGLDRNRATQLCKVDLLLLKDDRVKVIVEIEESGFNPTKICGKFLTSALATHYIHGRNPSPKQYGSKVLFIQILDGSKFSKRGASKESQCKLIETRINAMLPLLGCGITEYQLFIVNGANDQKRLFEVAMLVLNFV